MPLNKLKITLKDARTTYAEMSAKIGISYMAFQRKINGDSEFKLSEIKQMSTILELNGEEILDIFFNKRIS